jgi:tetratricopeptide (TPR) repeat protein
MTPSGDNLARWRTTGAQSVRGAPARNAASPRRLRSVPALTTEQIASLLQQANAHHGQGRLAEAEPLYAAALSAAPAHAGALHGLGLLRLQQGQVADAAHLLRAAVDADPQAAQARSNLAYALQALGRLDEAVQSYGDAIRLSPGLAAAHYGLGTLLAAQQRLDAAIASLENAIAARPDHVEAHFNAGTLLAAQGRHEQAYARFEAVVAISPSLPEGHYNVGVTLVALDRRADAVSCFETAIALRPDFTAAYRNLAAALAALGRNDDAAVRLQQLLQLSPDDASVCHDLGVVLSALGRTDAAIVQYERAVALRPDHVETRISLAHALGTLDRIDAALEHLEAALVLRPQDPKLLHERGDLLLRGQRSQAAVEAYEQAIAADPGYVEAHNNLGNALIGLGRSDDAIAHFEQALALKSDIPEIHNNLGNLLQQVGRAEEALPRYDAAIALKPDYADAYANRGQALVQIGRIDDGRQSFETAIALSPRSAGLYHHIMYAKKFSADDVHLAAMEELAKDSASLPLKDRTDLHFALSKALEDVGRHEEAFRHLVDGNALHRRSVVYNEPAALAYMDSTPQLFTADVMQRLRGLGNRSSLPVFIVGMPRSGTTLIEQILASHPQVFGAGELGMFESIIPEMPGLDMAIAASDAWSASETWHELGARYVAQLVAMAPEAERITDKSPGNFRVLGFIHAALPNARIIHIRRDPVDTCLSCFSKLFTHGQNFSYDLGELGRFYRAYDRQMAHWRSVLPPRAFLEVRYEDVVADLEGQARRIIEHCNLSWDEACLEFYRTQRPVRTASATQVRKPIYNTSVGRARVYGDLLGPLLEALGPELAGSTIAGK